MPASARLARCRRARVALGIETVLLSAIIESRKAKDRRLDCAELRHSRGIGEKDSSLRSK
jgi:hypothetical protein